MNKILVVDDDNRIRDLLSAYLTQHEYNVVSVASVAQARAQLAVHTVNLIILDIMLPQETGLDFLQNLRKQSNYLNLPVILLTARGGTNERIEGLSHGADDYLPKPFEPEELLLRMRAILKRSQPILQISETINIGDFRFDYESGNLYDECNPNQPVYLTSTEVAFLRTLSQYPNTPFARQDLAKRAGYQISDRSIDVQITRLRKKLNDDPPRYLKTVRHVGYMLCPAG